MANTLAIRNRLLAALILIAGGPLAIAQYQGAPPPPPPPPPGANALGGAEPSLLPQNEIEQLVAPIALYPDVLVSQILPAATFPTDIVMAARWCRDHPDLNGLDEQPWDLSVISICHYPPVLEKMDRELDWTNALGAAFMDQPEAVMAAIQTLRHQAEAAGALASNEQQTVVNEQNQIIIVPTQQQVVYVPQYDPQVIYVDNGGSAWGTVAASAISFGVGFGLGAWLDNDCNWYGGTIVACRPGYWSGWRYCGAVNWDRDWAAYRGPRRGYVGGKHGGAYVGPRGAAVWGNNGHGAAWRRPVGRPLPAYTGRYSNYSHISGNRRNVVAGNTINVNRNNVNIDRGDRNYYRGGNRTNINSGNRTNVRGGDRTYGGSNRDYSAFRDNRNTSNINRESNRGQHSRSSSSNRSYNRSSNRSSGNSAFSHRSSGSDVRRQSSRGSSSRKSHKSSSHGSRSGGRRGGGGRRR